MNRHSNGESAPQRLHTSVRLFFFLVAGVALITAITLRAGSIKLDRLFRKNRSRQIDRLSVAAPTPTPLPCPPCWQPLAFSENFDGVTPPALPPGWLATNAQGPPPLWVTSNSGVPLPPADTLPNAAFVDDPAVVSDKRLDSPGLTFFEGLRGTFNLPAQLQS